MSEGRAAIALALALAVGLASGPARADEASKSKAIALFDEGQKDMKAGNYEKACKAFEASNRLLADSGTRGSLARCYAQLGKTASAWALWRELADTAPSSGLRADAAAQAKKLEPRLAHYTVKVASPARGFAVTVAGQPVDLSIDVPAPIDPGTYPVEATAPGRAPWKGKLTAIEGETAEVAVPALAAAAAGKPAGPAGPGSGERRDAPIVTGSSGSGRRIAGLTFLAVGIGGLATGGAFGLIARARNDDVRKFCGGDVKSCPEDKVPDAEKKTADAESAANISTVAFIAGGAVTVTGLILYLTAPKKVRRAVSIAPFADGTTAGLALSGRY